MNQEIIPAEIAPAVLTEYEKKQIIEIMKFEERPPSALANAAAGAAKLVNMANYQGVITQVATLAQPLIEHAVNGADLIAQNATVAMPHTFDDLSIMDSAAGATHSWAVGGAAALGGAAGVTGLPGLAADIAGIVTLAIRTVRQVGACYGYTDLSKDNVIAILSMSSPETHKNKIATLIALRQARMMTTRTTFKAMAGMGGSAATIIGIREFTKTLGIQLTKRKILQIIPLIGAGVGAAVISAYLNDVSWEARRYFQRSWLEDRGKLAPRDAVSDTA